MKQTNKQKRTTAKKRYCPHYVLAGDIKSFRKMSEALKKLSYYSRLAEIFLAHLALIVHQTLDPVRDLNPKLVSSQVTLKQLTTSHRV